MRGDERFIWRGGMGDGKGGGWVGSSRVFSFLFLSFPRYNNVDMRVPS